MVANIPPSTPGARTYGAAPVQSRALRHALILQLHQLLSTYGTVLAGLAKIAGNIQQKQTNIGHGLVAIKSFETEGNKIQSALSALLFKNPLDAAGSLQELLSSLKNMGAALKNYEKTHTKKNTTNTQMEKALKQWHTSMLTALNNMLGFTEGKGDTNLAAISQTMINAFEGKAISPQELSIAANAFINVYHEKDPNVEGAHSEILNGWSATMAQVQSSTQQLSAREAYLQGLQSAVMTAKAKTAASLNKVISTSIQNVRTG